LPLRAKRKRRPGLDPARLYDESPKKRWKAIAKTKDVERKNPETFLCEKTVKKYQAKYNGYQLRRRRFAYLMSKGYSVDEVKKVLEECL
jgi:SOS response regulatory protein OraA/RecX